MNAIARRDSAELDCGGEPERDEEDQSDQLRDFEGRLGLRGGEDLQGRDPFEGPDDQDEENSGTGR